MRILAAYKGGSIGISEYPSDDFDKILTKRQIQERKKELHEQKKQYEQNNRIFMSEERKKYLSE